MFSKMKSMIDQFRFPLEIIVDNYLSDGNHVMGHLIPKQAWVPAMLGYLDKNSGKILGNIDNQTLLGNTLLILKLGKYNKGICRKLSQL